MENTFLFETIIPPDEWTDRTIIASPSVSFNLITLMKSRVSDGSVHLCLSTQRHQQPVSRLANTNLTGAEWNINAKAMWLKLKAFRGEQW